MYTPSCIPRFDFDPPTLAEIESVETLRRAGAGTSRCATVLRGALARIRLQGLNYEDSKRFIARRNRWSWLWLLVCRRGNAGRYVTYKLSEFRPPLPQRAVQIVVSLIQSVSGTSGVEVEVSVFERFAYHQPNDDAFVWVSLDGRGWYVAVFDDLKPEQEPPQGEWKTE